MKHADFIIVLGNDGQVLEQGSYEDLRSHADGNLELHNTDYIIPDARSKYDSREHNLPQESTSESPDGPSQSDQRRKVADLSIYKYYFSALGWPRISALLLFLVVEAGISGFRCKLLCRL